MAALEELVLHLSGQLGIPVTTNVEEIQVQLNA